jgi:hypothetical protein
MGFIAVSQLSQGAEQGTILVFQMAKLEAFSQRLL